VCTVTLFRLPGGCLRLACNRDEQRTRPDALPPQIRRCGERRAIMPIDPAGGGTWIAANDAGVAMALLNRNGACCKPEAGRRSRGLIIPELIKQTSVAQSLIAVGGIDAADYGPFRLLLVDQTTCAQLSSDGCTIHVEQISFDASPLLLTSSGLGDDLVAGPRAALFRRMLRGGISEASQDQFHSHGWPDRRHLSVSMRRSDARTVSFTTVSLSEDAIDFRYHAGAPDEEAMDIQLQLSLTQQVLA
jgi:hypothetical protein